MRKSLRILIVGDFLPDVGGVSQYVFNLAFSLIRSGHKVTIFHTRIGLDRDLGIFYVYRLPHSLIHMLKYVLKGSIHVLGVIRILPLVMIKPKLLLMVMLYAGRLSEIIEKTKAHIIHSNHLAIRSLVAYYLAKKRGIPCIITAHGYDTEYPPNKLEYLIRKKCTGMANKVIVPTLWKALRVIKLYNAENIDVIPNFIPCHQLDENQLFHLKMTAKQILGYANKFVITFIGRIIKEKGVFDIVKIARDLKVRDPNVSNKVTFIIAGAGPAEQELVESIKSSKLFDLVSYIGKIDETLKSKLLFASDIFLLLTYWTETFPMALVEAMNHGAVPIVYYFPGVQEILKHGEEGFILPQSDVQGLLSVVKGLVLGEINVYQMQLKALYRSKNFCAERVVPSISNIYWRVLYEKHN